MATIPPNNVMLSIISSYLNQAVPQADLNYLFFQASNFLHEQTKHFVFAGIGLSALGTVYTAVFNSANQWVFYASGCAICLGTAYRQGWLEKGLQQAQTEIERLKRSLTVSETALSDRDLLLKELGNTKEKLKETSEILVTAGENEKKLIEEISAIKEQLVKLTAVTMFFQTLKETYPDPKVFLEHLASIEKITKVTQELLARNDIDLATKFMEQKAFVESLSKQQVDQMALLIEINKKITVVGKGVDTANGSLEVLKSQRSEVA